MTTMDIVKKLILAESLKRYASHLDRDDLAFVREVAFDPRFSRLMAKVPGGRLVESELKTLFERWNKGD